MDYIEKKPIIPKQLKTITNLYRLCNFEEAEQMMSSFDKLPHQIANIKAQLAFFKWDFDLAIEYILEYYEYLYEWYSGNATDDTVLMLEYALLHCSSSVRKKATEDLYSIYLKYSEKERDDRLLSHIKYITQIIDIADGKLQQYTDGVYSYKKYSECPDPMGLDKIIEEYKEIHKKEFSGCKSDILQNARFVDGVLSRIKSKGKPKDFVDLYEANKKSSLITMHTSMDAVRIYMYLNEPDKAKQAIIDLVKYRWWPVEWTEIMPLSALVGLECFGLFDKSLFDTIYNIPKGVDQDLKNESKKLVFGHNFDDIFELKEFAGFTLSEQIISKISVPSGKLIVSDPLVYLDNHTLPFIQKVPKGEYDVVALFATDKKGNSIITAVRISFSDSRAEIYRNALTGKESQVDINDLDDGEYFGFSVDSGLVTIIDEKVKRDYLKFQDKWERKNKEEEFYEGYLMERFIDSAKNHPEFQRKCGDFIDLVLPDNDYHIPIFSSGAGDGFYPVYFGYDKKNKVCSIIVEFIEAYE